MKNISLISVFNNKEKLHEMVDSANKQTKVNIDYVLVDNTGHNFNSAAEALNFGIKKAIGEVLVFLHQDIVFLDNNQLNYIYEFAVNNKSVLFGPAGVESREINKNCVILSSMFEGKDKHKYTSLDQPMKCFTLDECLIACHKDCLKNVSFDEVTCDGWHLYGADLCLQANLFSEMCVMVIPMNIWHKSNGNADKCYYITQNKLARKYNNKYKIINTTNGYNYTNSLKRFFLNIYRKVRY